jgi:hypothetical protein
VSTFEERRLARAAWPVRRVSLHDEALTDDRIPESTDARVAMVAVLTRTQWALANKELPRYTREEMPGRIVRRAR